MTLIHNDRPLATGMEPPGGPEPPDMARRIILIVEEQTHDPLLAESRIEEGGDNGDHGDNHSAFMATGDGGFGVHNMDPGAIVDGVLADLPEPARHHILPDLEEYRAGALNCSAI